MKYAIILDEKRQMIGNAERCGSKWIGQVQGRRLEAWRGNLSTVAVELGACCVIFVTEPIWLHGVIIA